MLLRQVAGALEDGSLEQGRLVVGDRLGVVHVLPQPAHVFPPEDVDASVEHAPAEGDRVLFVLEVANP